MTFTRVLILTIKFTVEDISINVVYRYFDNNGNVLSKGTEEILLKAVPQEFALHNNYPNPFNQPRPCVLSSHPNRCQDHDI